MCGGCSRQDVGDWVTPALQTIQARKRACRFVNELAGGPLRAEAVGAGFAVKTPTGRTVMAGTLSAVWTELLKHQSFEPQVVPPASLTGSPIGAEVIDRRVALVIADAPELAHRIANLWQASRVLWWTPLTTLDELLTAASADRLVVAVTAPNLDECLSAVTHPVVRLHTTVAALLHDGQGPAWATDVGGLDWHGLQTTLRGCPPRTTCHDLGLPEAAAWLTGLVLSGATRNRRTTVAVQGGRWVLDAADGHGLAMRQVLHED